MFVNPYPFTNGTEEGNGVTVDVTVAEMQGFQGNPFVVTEDNELKRELYDLQKMIDPGDPDKKREIWHMFPGAYMFTSEVYVNVPDGHVAYLTTPQKFLDAGCTISSAIYGPGYKGLIQGMYTVNGGECFMQPGQVVANLVMQKVDSGDK